MNLVVTDSAPSRDYYHIRLDRKVSADDIRNMDLDLMPGFRFTWKYDKHVKPEAKYSDEDKTKQFVR